jgi:DNA-binding Lrp family transcriptional regulator
LGRAAITARSALALLRRRFVTTIPALADDLGLSRPAANDAVERLVALGLAREVTGRARDRVFAYGAADTMAGALLVADVT